MSMNRAVKAALDSILSASADNASSFTCTEAETIADLFREANREADADQFILFHAEEDDGGDLHRCGVCDAILPTTDAKCPTDADHDTDGE